MPRFVLVVALFSISLALRRHSKSKRGKAKIEVQDAAVSRKAEKCDALADLTVEGHDLGEAASQLCRFWPKKFGEFPVDDTQSMAKLFEGSGELFAKIKNMSKAKDAQFCWKKLGMRELLGDESTVESEFCEKKAFGKCYGTCPDGMKPMTLVGRLAPVCSSACMQSSHQTPCGLGCSTGARTCVRRIHDQFGIALRNLGQIAGYLSGNEDIGKVVDQVLRVVDFALDVVFDVLRVAKTVWKEMPKDKIDMGVLTALYQYVLDEAKTVGKDLGELKSMLSETMDMILELMDGEFDWKEINMDFITETIMKHGESILGAANEFADAFVMPRCAVTSATNPDYDCDGDGYTDCKDWSYGKRSCKNSKDNGGQCEYRYKFGDMRLKNSCRCKK